MWTCSTWASVAGSGVTTVIDRIRPEASSRFLMRRLAAGLSEASPGSIQPPAGIKHITFLPFILNGSITLLTSLDFLGFGLPPESASLGRLLQQGNANLQAPWLGLTAVLTLGTILVLLIFVGEAVRDAFDPRKLIVSSQR